MDRDEELRAVWRGQKTETTVMTSEEVLSQDSKLSRRIRARNGLEYVAAAIVALYFGAIAVRPGDAGAVLRVGAALLVGAAVHVAFDLHRRGRAIPLPAVDAPTRACIAHHRAQLTRQRDLLAAAPRWYVAPFVPGLVTFTLGVGVDLHRHGETLRAVGSLLATVDAIIVAVLAFVLLANRYATWRLTRKIAALDE